MSAGQLVFTLLAVAAMWTASSCYRHYLRCELEIRRAEAHAQALEALAKSCTAQLLKGFQK